MELDYRAQVTIARSRIAKKKQKADASAFMEDMTADLEDYSTDEEDRQD